MADKVKVRTKMWPDRDHEVAPDEVAVLRRQGLLIEDKDDAKPADEKQAEAKPIRPGGGRSGGQGGTGGGDAA